MEEVFAKVFVLQVPLEVHIIPADAGRLGQVGRRVQLLEDAADMPADGVLGREVVRPDEVLDAADQLAVLEQPALRLEDGPDLPPVLGDAAARRVTASVPTTISAAPPIDASSGG